MPSSRRPAVTSSVLWFRRDLRLDDHPALDAARAAAGAQGRVVPLFVVDPNVLGPVGPNRRLFLAGALRELERSTGGALVLRRGDPRDVVPAVAAAVGAAVVTATADFGPYGVGRDRAVAQALGRAGARLELVGSPYAVAPGRARSAAGTGFQVFSAYYRAWEAAGWEAPARSRVPRWATLDSDAGLAAITDGTADPGSHGLPPWWEGLPLGPAPALPPPGAQAAERRLEEFVARALAGYAQGRDRPGRDGTSKMSPYLHFGCVHPRTVLERSGAGPGPEALRRELAWRDFFADVLWHRPRSAHEPWQPFGRHLHWDEGVAARARFQAWATGRTGYPLVDAAMRQLLAEGWVHNRARMVAASFLVKDLHLDWRLGARWFLWHLVDGDLSSNQHNWQWVAGTGTDAAPFHRVFNPSAQEARFDPDGDYVRRYVPELAERADEGGGEGGRPYPVPIVDHRAERADALERARQARMAVAKHGQGQYGGT